MLESLLEPTFLISDQCSESLADLLTAITRSKYVVVVRIFHTILVKVTCTVKLTCKPRSSDPELLLGVLSMLFRPAAAATTPVLRPAAAAPVPTPTISERFLKLAGDETME